MTQDKLIAHAALVEIADRYRRAYTLRDPACAPIAAGVRFSENNVEMAFPDASWDSITEEVGPALTVADVKTGHAGIFTAIMQNDTPGFLAVRLKVAGGEIIEIEHIVSTKRNLSGPPTPIGEVHQFSHDPDLAAIVPEADRCDRATLVALADGYFATLENNTGEIRGTAFTADAIRYENGKAYGDIEKSFRNGWYRFNERVRDRDHFLVDEERGLVMSRAFIDHKGVLDEYVLNDGSTLKSIFREPHSWSVLELFKIKAGRITAIEATFIAVPYYMRSPWT